jgi:hypothetical protein
MTDECTAMERELRQLVGTLRVGIGYAKNRRSFCWVTINWKHKELVDVDDEYIDIIRETKEQALHAALTVARALQVIANDRWEANWKATKG